MSLASYLAAPPRGRVMSGVYLSVPPSPCQGEAAAQNPRADERGDGRGMAQVSARTHCDIRRASMHGICAAGPLVAAIAGPAAALQATNALTGFALPFGARPISRDEHQLLCLEAREPR